MFMVMMLFSLVTAPGGTPAEQRILLVTHPQVWTAPRPDAPALATDWAPGRRVLTLEKKACPELGRSGGKQIPPEGGTTELAGIAEAACYRIEDGKVKGWMPDAWLAPPPQTIPEGKLDRIGAEPVDRFHGLAPEYAPRDLVAVGPLYDQEVKARLRTEAGRALELLIAAARRDGVKLEVVSGYRPWEKQQELYEKKLKEAGLAQNTVAKPGHSEHQLGTAVDLTDGDEAQLLKAGFGETAAGRWLRERAWTYGFALSFTAHNQAQTGVAPEPWHYRYWGIGLARSRQRQAEGEK